MRITVYGAANDVTGSCHLVDTESGLSPAGTKTGCRFLIDCGMFQGSEKLERLNYIPKGIKPNSLDAVVLTHGHLDHCGRLPLLAAQGYKGPIYCTEPTARIAQLVMTDSAKIQEEDTERENRKRAEEHLPPLEPLYGVDAVEKACKLFKPMPYGHELNIAEGITIKLVE